MSGKIRRLLIATVSIVVIFLAIILLVVLPIDPATICDASGEKILHTDDFSGIEQPLIDDAYAKAATLFGQNQQKCNDFAGQLLATYLEARDKDVVIIFSAGGWGRDTVVDSSGWSSIMDGIEEEFLDMSLNYLVLNHKRTARNLKGYIGEIMPVADIYSHKVDDLAVRVTFLTDHLPQTNIILTGESNGAGFCYDVFSVLEENPRVYSIQTGPPCWSSSTSSERTLVMRNNGVTPDAFSHGDAFTIIRSNMEALLGVSQQNRGNIMLYIGAPGHDYGWEYKEVQLQVTGFLNNHFKP